MTNQQDLVLRDVINSVQQRPQFDATGRETQVVVVAYTTPSGFTGTETMPLAEWEDPVQRFERMMNAVVRLEGPFWKGAEEAAEKE